MRTLTVVVTLAAFAVATVGPRAAAADEPDAQLVEARRHFEYGRAFFNKGDLAGAIREFKLAESVRPSPILDYNIGLAYEGLHKYRVALKYYQRYLQGYPNAPNRAEVEANIAALQQKAPPPPQQQPRPDPNGYAETEPNPAPPEPAPEGYDPYAQSPEAQPVNPPPPATVHHSYWWIWLVVIGGVVLIATIAGVAVYATSHGNVTAGGSAIVEHPRAPDSPNAPSPIGGVLFRF